MATRRIIWACLALAAMTATARAATVRTTNFIIETARQDDAEEFARLAEQYRREKALEWLGTEMPAWRQPCRVRISVTSNGAGGATTFDFARPKGRQEMDNQGQRGGLQPNGPPPESTRNRLPLPHP